MNNLYYTYARSNEEDHDGWDLMDAFSTYEEAEKSIDSQLSDESFHATEFKIEKVFVK